MPTTGYLAPEGFVRELQEELGDAVLETHGRLVLAEGPPRPAPGAPCLDLGGSPGGWAWVLQGLGARVVSVDKAPLDPRIATLPGITTLRESAFALDPQKLGNIDWLFSDVVCYPARLLKLVEKWLAAPNCPRFVCSVKFQGSTDHETARRFAAIPGSRLLHLHHNKHELTWIRLG